MKHNERRDQSLLTRMMFVALQEMKNECCEEVEYRRDYEDIAVGWL